MQHNLSLSNKMLTGKQPSAKFDTCLQLLYGIKGVQKTFITLSGCKQHCIKFSFTMSEYIAIM